MSVCAQPKQQHIDGCEEEIGILDFLFLHVDLLPETLLLLVFRQVVETIDGVEHILGQRVVYAVSSYNEVEGAR